MRRCAADVSVERVEAGCRGSPRVCFHFVYGVDACPRHGDAEPLVDDPLVVAVLQDDVQEVYLVADDRFGPVVRAERVERDLRIVHLADEVADVQTDDVVDAVRGVDAVAVQFAAVDMDGLAVEDDLLVGNPVLGLQQRRPAAEAHHLRRHLLLGEKIHPLLDPADRLLLDPHGRLVVEIATADAVGEIVAHEILDAVLEHVAYYERDEKRGREVAETLLEREADYRGEDHRQASGDAVVELFDDHPVAFLGSLEKQRAFDVFLQDARAEN